MESKNKPKVIVIVGPTASGKTALSIELAKKINGEIVSCDSMQIYKDMNIGSAKPTTDEMQGIKHYLSLSERNASSHSNCGFRGGRSCAVKLLSLAPPLFL